jgi:hypothetical protein
MKVPILDDYFDISVGYTPRLTSATWRVTLRVDSVDKAQRTETLASRRRRERRKS